MYARAFPCGLFTSLTPIPLQATVVSRTAVTTTLSACSGALMGLLINYGRHRVWDLLSTCIGALAGGWRGCGAGWVGPGTRAGAAGSGEGNGRVNGGACHALYQ